ncbi:hypothetical protein BCR36DRAFT_409512 [Piromyces finnis]|uniref:Uncharacterized protein n=1 Tax=Piromyces finnis TaxID=1754191 RepID=A0A1Y1VJF9_9FUNG|nr:hypothetical protein BCR36DRAFT_409512 [Piromyces finnis]|eukprot:ORX57192.1 hypothetical protein BCR36DRAFT_409512 [Piromyces finnis]
MMDSLDINSVNELNNHQDIITDFDLFSYKEEGRDNIFLPQKENDRDSISLINSSEFSCVLVSKNNINNEKEDINGSVIEESCGKGSIPFIKGNDSCNDDNISRVEKEDSKIMYSYNEANKKNNKAGSKIIRENENEKIKSIEQRNDITYDISQNSFESSLHWHSITTEKKRKKNKENKEGNNSTTSIKRNVNSDCKLVSNVSEIEKTIFNIREDTVTNENLSHPTLSSSSSVLPSQLQSKVVCCDDFSTVPQEILEDIKNYNELRLEEYQNKMIDKRKKQKANKKTSSSYQNSTSLNTSFTNSSIIRTTNIPYITKSKVGKFNYKKMLDSSIPSKIILESNNKENRINAGNDNTSNEYDRNTNASNDMLNEYDRNINASNDMLNEYDRNINALNDMSNGNETFNYQANTSLNNGKKKENKFSKKKGLDSNIYEKAFIDGKSFNSSEREEYQNKGFLIQNNLDHSSTNSSKELINSINKFKNKSNEEGILMEPSNDNDLNENLKLSNEIEQNNTKINQNTNSINESMESIKEDMENNIEINKAMKSVKELTENTIELNENYLKEEEEPSIKELTVCKDHSSEINSDITSNEEITISSNISTNFKRDNEKIVSIYDKDKIERIRKDVSLIQPPPQMEYKEQESKTYDTMDYQEYFSDSNPNDTHKYDHCNIKLLENYAEQDYQKEIANFQLWLQKKNQIEHEKKLELIKSRNELLFLTTQTSHNNYRILQSSEKHHKLVSKDNENYSHCSKDTEEAIKKRKEKNEKAYNDWLKDKLVQEKEKNIQALDMKMKQIERDKEELAMKEKIEKRKKERLKEWMNNKIELEKKKKRMEEKQEKAKELREEKQKQMDANKFKEWCQRKEQEKKKFKGKDLKEKFHVVNHHNEWIDPKNVPASTDETSSSKPQLSQSESVYCSKSDLYKGHNLGKSKGFLSSVSMSNSINGGLVINYKDSNLFTDSEKKLFSNDTQKTVKKKKKNKKNKKVNGSYGEGIFGDYDDTSENNNKNNKNKAISKKIDGNDDESQKKKKKNTLSSNATISSCTKSPIPPKNQNLPPSLFDDFKKYDQYPDFKRKYPLLVGNAGLEMLLLEQKELMDEEKKRGVSSKIPLSRQNIQITGRKDDVNFINLLLKGNISFQLDDGKADSTKVFFSSPISSQKTENKDKIKKKGNTKKKGQSNVSSVANVVSSTVSWKRKASLSSGYSNAALSSQKNSISAKRKSSVDPPKTKSIKDLIDPSLLQFLIHHQNLDYHKMCKEIKEKLLEDHIYSIVFNNPHSQFEKDEATLHSKYHTTRQCLSDLFQNKPYLENLLKSLSSSPSPSLTTSLSSPPSPSLTT